MSSDVYKVNKGVGKSVEFKGLKAQYIWWLAGGVIGVMILFAIMYIAGINQYLCIGIALGMGAFVVIAVFRISHKFGEYGLMKMRARKGVPQAIRSRSRVLFKRKP